MHRFIVKPGNVNNGYVTLEDEDLKHLRQVLRLGAGDIIRVFDGNGLEYEAELIDVDKNKALAKIISSFSPETEPNTKVTLFQGLPKGEKMELIIQKAVELGIFRIVPVITERTVVKLDEKAREKKAERWSRIAAEAAKQCKRAYIPEVMKPVSFSEAVNLAESCGATVVLYENEEKKCLKELLKCYTINKIRDIALFVGAEGGFSAAEVGKCQQKGFDIAGLGKRILRTETAAISVVSIIMYEMGELQ
ncbi:MAG: 16S rRNA (uracil(1498)-N(3))-methyltransferase [Clostridiaceae bacterium]|nr:16S rRNA (uracil(1498)-N(3))-methyltransferase [Clostridiaceae bacterium]